MRWEKNELFVEVESALSTNSNEAVLIVSSNAWNKLPLEFKEQVHESEREKCDALRTAVAAWARANGFLSK